MSLCAQSCLTLCRLYPWDFPGKNTCRGYHFLFQGIFLIQGLYPCLLHCRWILYPLEPLGKPLCCIRGFFNEWALSIRWSKYWSFSFSISLSNEYSGLISSRMHWFDLAVQGTLKSLLQHHSSKTSMLRCSVFFQLSHSYMTTGKPIALTIQTFVGKVMSLLFNTLSRFVIAFLLRSKHLLTLQEQTLTSIPLLTVTCSFVFPPGSHLFYANWKTLFP